MRIIEAADWRVERKVDYGTREQLETVQTIIRDVRKEGMERCSATPDSSIGWSWLRRSFASLRRRLRRPTDK